MLQFLSPPFLTRAWLICALLHDLHLSLFGIICIIEILGVIDRQILGGGAASFAILPLVALIDLAFILVLILKLRSRLQSVGEAIVGSERIIAFVTLALLEEAAILSLAPLIAVARTFQICGQLLSINARIPSICTFILELHFLRAYQRVIFEL